MRYILGISILYKSYKNKKSSIRIRSNDHFIDEISLDEDINMVTKMISSSFYNKHMLTEKKYPLYTAMMKKIVNNYKQKFLSAKNQAEQSDKSMDHWIQTADLLTKELDGANVGANARPKDRVRQFETPSKLFLYEIDEDKIGSHITMECSLDNNNYTNGFLTEYSNIKIHNIFLMPKRFLEEATFLKIARRLSKNEVTIPFPWMAWDFNEHNVWPSANKIKFHGDSYDPSANGGQLLDAPLGGTFSLVMDVIKKHGIRMFTNKERSYGLYSPDATTVELILLNDLINKFNEDQRSNHTKN